MTFQDWTESTRPKIQGSWNLHALLPKDLDFFIMLSSVSGIIGNPGQSNYNAGNTYQDALALFRHQNGLRGTSLAVGAVRDIGLLSSSPSQKPRTDGLAHLADLEVSLDEVLTTVTTIMKGRTSDGRPIPPTLVLGITNQLRREPSGSMATSWTKDRKFDHRVDRAQAGTGHSDDDEHVVRISELLSHVADLKEASQVVEEALKHNLASAMSSKPEDVDPDKPLFFYGGTSQNCFFFTPSISCHIGV